MVLTLAGVNRGVEPTDFTPDEIRHPVLKCFCQFDKKQAYYVQFI